MSTPPHVAVAFGTPPTSSPSLARVLPFESDVRIATVEERVCRQDHSPAAAIFDKIDIDGNGRISKLDFIMAVRQDRSVNEFVLPGIEGSRLMGDGDVFDAVDARFESLAEGKQLINLVEFVDQLRCVPEEAPGAPVVMADLFRKLDRDGDGIASKLDLILAMQKDAAVNDFFLPGFDANLVLSDDDILAATDGVWCKIVGERPRMSLADLSRYCNKLSHERTPKSRRCRDIFEKIDADGIGTISKLKFIASMQQHPDVDEFISPGADNSQVMNNNLNFNAVDAVFETIANGKKQIRYEDFERYFRHVAVIPSPVPRPIIDRKKRKVLIIGPGYGRELNPRQGLLIEAAGYNVHWVFNVPNPEVPNFSVGAHMETISAQLDFFQPDIVTCASKGGVYMAGLWEAEIWNGPSVLINAHPSCRRLPSRVPVVLAHGANDEVYPTGRRELEEMVRTSSSPDYCFLYYTANSGQLSPGMFTREGDHHNMESLILRDCLPRLIDAALCPDGPEVHMIRTWHERVKDERVASEQWIGYTPDRLRRLWSSPGRRGAEVKKLLKVNAGSEEFQHVAAVFKAHPKETPAYNVYPPAEWDKVRILQIDRVENGEQERSTRPYYDSVRKSVEGQGLEFEPGIHTSWAFHGADVAAIESIVSDPVIGFQPLASGSRNSAVWGAGSYFARDAQYVAGSHFCGPPARDGTRQMLMCLLVTGMPCLGDPDHRGVLPFRRKPHRYNSSVDSLSSPEVYVVQHSGAATPAYVITFA